jgi:hypothetical protein
MHLPFLFRDLAIPPSPQAIQLLLLLLLHLVILQTRLTWQAEHVQSNARQLVSRQGWKKKNSTFYFFYFKLPTKSG